VPGYADNDGRVRIPVQLAVPALAVAPKLGGATPRVKGHKAFEAEPSFLCDSAGRNALGSIAPLGMSRADKPPKRGYNSVDPYSQTWPHQSINVDEWLRSGRHSATGLARKGKLSHPDSRAE